MWITNMGNHGAAGVSQNAVVLVVLVDSDNNLSASRQQAIIWANDGVV